MANTAVHAQRREYSIAEIVMSKNSDIIPVRLSHLLRHCSVGAIVRGPEYLMTVKDIREWTDKNEVAAGRTIPYVDQVRGALGISQELREPPVAKELDKGHIDGVCVPAMRFPSWMRCPNPKCGLLYYRPWRSQTRGELQCEHCDNHPALEQVPWLLAHRDGHMDDVPWHFIAHDNAKKAKQLHCRRDSIEPYLHLTDEAGSNLRLRCGRCEAYNVFSDSIRIPYAYARRQPWIKEAAEIATGPSEDEAELGVVLEVNDVRVHAPRTCNALVIPPESRIRKGTIVDRLYSSSQKLQQIERAKTPLALNAAVKRLAEEFRCTEGEIEAAWKEIKKGYPLYGENITPGLLRESEYQALLSEIPDICEDEDFVTRHLTRTWKAMLRTLPEGSRPRKIVDIVSRLISVNRLKEVQIMKGFQRLGGELVPPDIVNQSIWLPAIELYGEGIFFTLKEKILTKWEKLPGPQERENVFQRRYVKAGLQFDPELKISSRFLLLHTVAHLLIRQLEAEAGYPAASLKERVYCSSGILPMAGILVYVAVPDVVGSLGGLSELAEPRRFLSLLSSVFDHAEWCSLDPVCSEHEGQGPSLLNRAACHACALVPEPSCAYGNVFLDRTFIKGDAGAGIPSLLELV